MVKGCSALVSQSSWWNVIARLLCLDADYDDDGDAGTELLVGAQDGLRADNVLSILRKNPGLIRVADPVEDTVLHVAARAGDIETMCKLIAFIKARPDWKRRLTDTNVDGDTPLHVAVKNGHKEAAHHLAIAQGQMMYICNNNGKDAHQLAEEAGYNELCEVMDMLSYELCTQCSGLADVEMGAVKKDLMGMSKRASVHWMEIYRAIQKSEEDDLVTVLMRVRDGKKLLRYQDQSGETLLHDAVKVSGEGPLRQLVQFMISNGLTDAALLRDNFGNTALHCAVYRQRLIKALDLIKAAPRAVYQVNNEGDSPLYLAIKTNYQDLVMNMFNMLSRSSIPAYASEILLHPKNATLAHRAIKSRNLGTLQTVVEHLPKLINATDKKDGGLFHTQQTKVTLKKSTTCLPTFRNLKRKYDIDGSLPIHKAVGGGKVAIIEAFLSHCPQALQHVDRKGRSVLHIAVRYARADILDYLTKNIKMDDSFLNLKDNEGKTFMDYATERARA